MLLMLLRVRVRKLKEAFAEAGLSFEALAASTQSLQRADAALEHYTEQAQSQLCAFENETASVQKELFSQPLEVQLRLVERVIKTLTGAAMAPRTSKREALLHKMENGRLPATLGGVKVADKNGVFLFEKEG